MVRRRGFTYTELLCVMAIALIMWMLILPGAVRSRNRADDAACKSNLRNISWALAMYAQDHYGLFPPELPALTPRYLYERDIYRCPRVVAAEKRFPEQGRVTPEGGTDYAYMPGLAQDDHPKEAVAWDREPWHRRGANVLYLSGAVTRVDEAELKRLNAALGPTPTGGGSP
jgi:prepilin-type N-terminal cleavage/methylation domain-containing protein